MNVRDKPSAASVSIYNYKYYYNMGVTDGRTDDQGAGLDQRGDQANESLMTKLSILPPTRTNPVALAASRATA